jgi:hypothetical protein
MQASKRAYGQNLDTEVSRYEEIKQAKQTFTGKEGCILSNVYNSPNSSAFNEAEEAGLNHGSGRFRVIYSHLSGSAHFENHR